VSERSESAIVLLVLAAVGGVLAAPVLGRLGAPVLADSMMWVAAGCGVAAFVVTAVSTFRAARRDGRRDTHEAGQ
jgi:hypothetical protein